MRRTLFPAGLSAVVVVLFAIERGWVDQALMLAVVPSSILGALTLAEFAVGRWRPAARRLPRDLGFFVVGGVFDAAGRVLVTALALALGSNGFGPAASLPALLAVPLGLVIADLGAWLVHRGFHAQPALWKMHTRHHAPTELYALMSSVNAPLMILIIRAVPPLVLVLCGFTPFVLVAWTLLDAWIGMSSHTGVDTHNPWLSQIFVTPEVHRLHHSADRGHAGNHGLAVTVWDRVFGTWVSPAKHPGVPEPGLATR